MQIEGARDQIADHLISELPPEPLYFILSQDYGVSVQTQILCTEVFLCSFFLHYCHTQYSL